MTKVKLLYAFMALLLSFVRVSAQQVSVTAKIDSISIIIGKQAHLTVEVSASGEPEVVFPRFKRSQYIVPGVEVIDESPTETSEVDGLQRVIKTYTLTSFDEKLYAIPGVNVKVNGKPMRANTLALKVITCDVDTLHPEKFFPPKDVQDNPFLWSEWEPLFWISVLVVLLNVFILYIALRLKQNKPIIMRIKVVKRIPPHQKALDEINSLRNTHLDSTNEQKQYYTKLTEALRRYIESRFGFNAMEMTSSEILEHLQNDGNGAMIDELRELFVTADLVKFAKYSSLLNENDMNLVNAINFIDQTKRNEVPTEEKIIPKLDTDEQKNRNRRIVLKWTIWLSALLMSGLLVYVVYHVYMLLI